MSAALPPAMAEPALEVILERLAPRLKRILSRYRIPVQDADDLLQETLLIMIAKSASIRNPDSWLVATLANRCIIYWRKHRRLLWDQVDTAILELLADAGVPSPEREDLRCDLESLLANLPERCRSALRLRYGFGCSTVEAAEKMGYRPSSFRKVNRRCLAALAQQLLGEGFRPAPSDSSGR